MDLVVLAAGMGSRFGGLKQVEPIDEEGNFILNYSIYDAVKAGFDRVVLIIKEENLELFKERVGKRLEKVVPVCYAFQKITDVPKGFEVKDRVKPWGTAHALYCARHVVGDRFAVINADDFYGYESFKIIADFLKTSKDNEFISAGYYVKNTITDKGAVKRGIFTVKDGKAVKLIESQVEKRDGEIVATPLGQDIWEKVSPNTLVSMTMFGFSKKLMTRIEEDFYKFFQKPADELEKGEFLLPDEVNVMMQSGEITLYVQTTPAKWYGITYKEELEGFKQAISDMKKQGKYPIKLY